MKNATEKSLLKKLLINSSGSVRKWTAWTAMCLGATLLFLAVLLWWNFEQLLNGKSQKDSIGSTFLVISKKITNENMSDKNAKFFTEAEITRLRHAPEVQNAGVLTPGRFPVSASMGNDLGFYTELFLEAAPKEFIDKTSDAWEWKTGEISVPLILSGDFLNLYNYGFAPSQGLPQLSEETVKALSFQLTIGPAGSKEIYAGHVVGFSDRISSVLVPESFMNYANEKFSPLPRPAPMRVILKTRNPSDEKFIHYLEDRGYTANAEMMRWNKVRSLIQVTEGATGLIAILLLGVSTMAFMLFIELILTRAQASVRLLIQLGYAPKRIGKYMFVRFLPTIAAAILAALVVTLVAQIIFAESVKMLFFEPEYIPGWPVFATALLCFTILILRLQRVVHKAIRNIV